LVSDDVIIGMVKNRLQKDDAVRGAIFDGFPRTIPQAEALGNLLVEMGLPEPVVVNIDVPDDEIIRRLSSRRVCATCGAVFNLDMNPDAPAKHACPAGTPNIIQRDDDQPETVRKRLQVYQEKTAPLIDYYKKRSSLRTVSGMGNEKEVFARVLIALDSGIS
jgi:adenylate kinase